MDSKLQPVLSELGRRLKTIYGRRLVSVFLFGSQARGEALPGSDVDLLVVLEGPVRPGDEIGRTGPLVSDLSLRHDLVLSLIFVSSQRFSNEQSPLFLNVRREGLAL